MSRESRIASCLVIVCLLSACTTSAPAKVFTESTCEPPCWNEIVPGQSDSTAVRTALQNLMFIDQTSSRNQEFAESAEEYSFYRVVAQGGELLIYLRDDRVVWVDIRAVMTGETIADLIDRLGAPEGVFAEYDGVENVKYIVYLFYPSKGATYAVYDRPQGSTLQDEDRIEADMILTDATFAVPDTLQAMLADMQVKEGRIQCIQDHLQPWSGYGPIKVVPIGVSC